MDNAFDLSTPTPTHHPPEALLIDFAAGNMSEVETLVMELHLDACAQCRRATQTAFAIGGALLEAIAPAQLPRDLLERTLQSINAAVPESRQDSPAQALPSFTDRWPARLRNHLSGRPPVSWRRLPAGFRAMELPFSNESKRLLVMSAPGGRGTLHHSHSSDEWTLILEGGYTDETGTYAAGDFAYMTVGDQHRLLAEAGEGCICLLLSRDTPRYTTLAGKLLAQLIKLY